MAISNDRCRWNKLLLECASRGVAIDLTFAYDAPREHPCTKRNYAKGDSPPSACCGPEQRTRDCRCKGACAAHEGLDEPIGGAELARVR